MYTMYMKKIHKTKRGWRPPLGDPYELMATIVAAQANTDNLSANWNTIDGARKLMAAGWKALTKSEIPKDAKVMLKPYSKDLEV